MTRFNELNFELLKSSGMLCSCCSIFTQSTDELSDRSRVCRLADDTDACFFISVVNVERFSTKMELHCGDATAVAC